MAWNSMDTLSFLQSPSTPSRLSTSFGGNSLLSYGPASSSVSLNNIHSVPNTPPRTTSGSNLFLSMLPEQPGYNEIAYTELVFANGWPGAHCRLGMGGYGEVFLASWQGELAVAIRNPVFVMVGIPVDK